MAPRRRWQFRHLVDQWYLGLFVVVMACLLVVGSAAAAEGDGEAASGGGDARVSEEGGPTVLLVVGAPGADEYAERFGEWVGRWRAACEAGAAELVRVGSAEMADASSGSGSGPAEGEGSVAESAANQADETAETDEAGGGSGQGDDGEGGSSDGPTDRELLREAIRAHGGDTATALWIVMIGHGTFDGRSAKFNLDGPDVAASELASWVAEVERPLAVVNTASASGPFLNALSAPGRVVVTATKSGDETSFARFGGYFAAAVGSLEADLDKDDQVSLLEAFLFASNRVQRFYEKQNRLATEHALLDDNGDGLGTRAGWFRGVRATKTAASGAEPDGYRAHQFHLIRSEAERQMSPELRAQRNELELKVLRLRDRRDQLDDEAYFNRLEALLVPLARVYRQARQEREWAGESDPPREGE